MMTTRGLLEKLCVCVQVTYSIQQGFVDRSEKVHFVCRRERRGEKKGKEDRSKEGG